jgi:hypothetical protein
MAKYAALVASASEGAVTTGRRMTAGLARPTGHEPMTVASVDELITAG